MKIKTVLKDDGIKRITPEVGYWDLFKYFYSNRFSKLILANLLLLLAILPTIFVTLLMKNTINNVGLPTGNFGVSFPIIGNVALSVLSTKVGVRSVMFLYYIPAMLFASVFFSGIFYMCRNLLWTDEMSFKRDFIKGIGTNILNFLIIFAGIGLFIYGVQFLVSQLQILMISSKFLGGLLIALVCVVALFFAAFCFIMMAYSSLFKMNIVELAKASFYTMRKALFLSLGITFVFTAPLALILLTNSSALSILGIAAYGTIVMSLMVLAYTLFADYCLDWLFESESESLIQAHEARKEASKTREDYKFSTKTKQVQAIKQAKENITYGDPEKNQENKDNK